MSTAAKQPEAPAPQMQGSPPGPVQWCANCVHFRPGPIVVNGNTLGGCFVSHAAERMTPSEAFRIFEQGQRPRPPREVTASDWCEQHRQRVGVQVFDR